MDDDTTDPLMVYVRPEDPAATRAAGGEFAKALAGAPDAVFTLALEEQGFLVAESPSWRARAKPGRGCAAGQPQAKRNPDRCVSRPSLARLAAIMTGIEETPAMPVWPTNCDKEDLETYTGYQGHFCAWALHRLYALPLVTLQAGSQEEAHAGRQSYVHSAVRTPDGLLWDAAGGWREDEFLAHYKRTGRRLQLVTVSPEEFKRHSSVGALYPFDSKAAGQIKEAITFVAIYHNDFMRQIYGLNIRRAEAAPKASASPPAP